LRTLLLERFGAHLRRAGGSDPLCVIKEPNGSQGAGFILFRLPCSRLLFLLRDGRDVVDSELDASGKDT